MAEELTIEEAKKLVAKFSNPEHKNKEHELFQSAAAKLLEEINPEFEYEYEEESEEVQEGSRTEVELNNFDKNAFEKIKEYTSDVFRNIRGLGAAGMVTFASAAYFQANEAFETTHGINTVIQQTEANYGESLFSYIVSAIKGEKSESEETTEESSVQSTEKSESESEETTEESSVQSTPESSVQSIEESSVQSDSGIESDNQQEQPKDSDKNEQQEESKDEESDIETNSSETKPDLQTDPVQSETNDSGDIDPIKPHQDFSPEPVITPYDAITVSPEGVY